ncbi:transposase [Thermaurantiacus sp.]
MARLARVVAPGFPHHVTQRGNRGQPTFFGAADYALYRDELAANCRQAGVCVLAWCLMPNHVHLILVPGTADGLRAALAGTHRRYSRHINLREGWRGYLWQGRFASAAIDEPHLLAAVWHIETNPVRAGLVAAPGDWPWSSARAHLLGLSDGLTDAAPLLRRIPDWPALLRQPPDEAALAALRAGERTGRPVGSASFLAELEAVLGRRLARQRPGRKPRSAASALSVAPDRQASA